jgi:hypothetical protein
MKKEMLCVLGARPQTPGIYRIVAKGKWHLIRQWNANLFPLAYRLSPVACLRSARAADNSEDPRKIDSTWHIQPASGKRELGLSPLTRDMVAVGEKMNAVIRIGKQRR